MGGSRVRFGSDRTTPCVLDPRSVEVAGTVVDQLVSCTFTPVGSGQSRSVGWSNVLVRVDPNPFGPSLVILVGRLDTRFLFLYNNI